MNVRTKCFGTKKRKIVAAFVTGMVLVATAGLGAWLVTTITGAASAKTGQLIAPTVANAATPVGDLYPSAGLLTGALQVAVNNPNSTALVLTGLDAVSKANIVGGTAQCDFSTAPVRAYVNVKGTPSTGLAIPVPVGSTTVLIPAMVGLASNTDTQCQNQVINGFGVSNLVFSTP